MAVVAIETDLFRLPRDVWEPLFEKKYYLTKWHSNKNVRIPFSLDRLVDSLKWFVNNKLVKLNQDLYAHYQKRELKPGYNTDTFYRLFGEQEDNTWNPPKELINLLCYYLFNKSYIDSVGKKLIPDNLKIFKKLRSYIESQARKARHLQSPNNVEERLVDSYKNRIDHALLHSGGRIKSEIESCIWEDIIPLNDMHLKVGGVELSWEIIEHRLALSPNIFRGLKILTDDETILVGFYILYPINKSIIPLLRDGSIIRSDQIEDKHICESFKDAEAIYISTVFAFDHPYGSKANLLKRLERELTVLLLKYPQLTGLYTKPRTDDGKRIAKQNDFVKLERSPTIFYLSREEVLEGFSGL